MTDQARRLLREPSWPDCLTPLTLCTAPRLDLAGSGFAVSAAIATIVAERRFGLGRDRLRR
jgi:hypothetical protein